MFLRKDKIHFIGIGGSGMCPLAEVLHANGQIVTGSDAVCSATTERLESLGISIEYSHIPGLVKNSDIAVYSSAIKENNQELFYARTHNIPCMKRAEILGNLMQSMCSIGVAGTHGKTTTTSLIGHIFNIAGKNPTVIAGGTFIESQSNAMIGNSSLLIVEADEYDRSFLKMFPFIGIITNIEPDHLDIYKDFDSIKEAFQLYINKIPFYGSAVICKDDPVVSNLNYSFKNKVITYGISCDADYNAIDIQEKNTGSSFSVVSRGKLLGIVDLPLSGIHNVNNALAAIAVAFEMNIPFITIKNSLGNFKGIKRRFETLGIINGITIVSDYAHHPTEIKATLLAARKRGYSGIVTVFQPHLYSRTREFYREFAESLAICDHVIVTGVYKAREDEVNRISGSIIVDKMIENGYCNCVYIEDMSIVPEYLEGVLKDGNCCMLMGAGNIDSLGQKIISRLEND